MKQRIAVIAGYRSAMGKAGGVLQNLSAQHLGSCLAKEVIAKSNLPSSLIDEVIIGNVSQPAEAANIAKIIASQAGIPQHVPAFTVHRNCASGLEAFTSAIYRLKNHDANLILAGGVESMSNIPLLYNKKFTNFFANLAKSKTAFDKFKALLKFKPAFLQPIIGLMQGLTDPLSGLIMGCTAENIARDFAINRNEQDEFALQSHQKAQKAIENNIFSQEIIAIFNLNEQNPQLINQDEGVRFNQKLADLAKLKPYFEKNTGTVTVGNSSQITDGACFALLALEEQAKEFAKQYDCEILGYITDFAYAGLDPSKMGLGPVFSTKKLFDKTGLSLKDFDLIEINEAFSAQVLGCLKAFASANFCQEQLNLNSALGEIDPAILNVNGGAIALGHPVGMSGARIVVHLLRELKRRGKNRGLASLCVGGGQGGSCVVEVD